MTIITNRRSTMTLYTNDLDPLCHRVRIVLAEKGVNTEFIEVDKADIPEELFEFNPYGSVPTLVDRDLVLYESTIVMEYLEERFPHPPLMPVYPVARARNRLMMSRVDRDWYSLANIILTGSKDKANNARKELTESLLSVAPVFANSPYFLSDEFTLVDCSLAALLWRLPLLNINLNEKNAKPIINYAKKLFKRESFQKSLTEAEREIHQLYDEKA